MLDSRKSRKRRKLRKPRESRVQTTGSPNNGFRNKFQDFGHWARQACCEPWIDECPSVRNQEKGFSKGGLVSSAESGVTPKETKKYLRSLDPAMHLPLQSATAKEVCTGVQKTLQKKTFLGYFGGIALHPGTCGNRATGVSQEIGSQIARLIEQVGGRN